MAGSSSSLVITVTPSNRPEGCSFDGKLLVVKGEPLAFIYYKDTDEIWMPAKPVMKITGEKNITDFVNRVHNDDKMAFKDLAEAKGLPSEGCSGFLTPPNPADYNEGKAIWVNESGFYKGLLSSRKTECERSFSAGSRKRCYHQFEGQDRITNLLNRNQIHLLWRMHVSS